MDTRENMWRRRRETFAALPEHRRGSYRIAEVSSERPCRHRSKDALCHGLALHGWQGQLDPERWRAAARDFFARVQAPAILAVLKRADGAEAKVWYPDVDPWLATPLPYGTDMTYLGLFTVDPDHVALVFGWVVMADLCQGPNASDRALFWGWRADLPLALEDATTVLAGPLADEVSVPYGTGYTLPFRRGPELYALGLEAGLGHAAEDGLERQRVARWGHDLDGRQRYLQGLLRDLYPVNLISAPHLARTVRGRPLPDWIAAVPGRGTLAPLAGGLWQWRLTPEEIAQVRPALVAEGLLIAELPFPEAWR